MFGKKNKIPRYAINYGKTPVLDRRFKRSKPKFSRTGPAFFTRFKKIFFLIIFTAGLIFTIYSILFSNYFKVKNIVITNASFSNENLTKEVKEKLKTALNKSIFWIDETGLEKKLIDSFSELEQVTINKNYPDTLDLEFFEYPLVANVINETSTIKKSYLINAIGFAVKEDFENPELPYIKIKSDEPINSQKAVLEKPKLTYILESIKYFEDKFGMQVNEVTYKPVARELHLLTEKKFYIWLDIQRSYEDQFKKLKKAIVKLDIFKENLEYIDLRIAGNSGEKIIYKRKSL